MMRLRDESAERYLEEHFRGATDRALARRVGWTRAEVEAFLAERGLVRTAEDRACIREQGSALPELSAVASWFGPVAPDRRSWLIAIGVATIFAMFGVARSTGGVGSVSDAAAALAAHERSGASLALGPYPSLAKLVATRAGEPAHALALLSTALAGLAAALAVLALRGASCPWPAAAGGAGALITCAPFVSASAGAGPEAATVALVLGAVVAFLVAGRRWSALSFGVAAIVALALALHLFIVPVPAGGTSTRMAAAARVVAWDLSPIAGPLAIAGAAVLWYRSAGLFSVWLVPLLFAALTGIASAVAPLAAFPVALAIRAIGERCPRVAWSIAALVIAAGATLRAFDREPGSALIHEFGENTARSIPDGSRVWIAGDRLEAVVRYFVVARGRSAVTIERGSPPGIPPADTQNFIVGHSLAHAESDKGLEPFGLAWRIRRGGRQPPRPKDIWQRLEFTAFDPADALSLGSPPASSDERSIAIELALSRALADDSDSEVGNSWIVRVADLAVTAGPILFLVDRLRVARRGETRIRELLDHAISIEPDSVETLRELAELAVAEKDFDRARALAERARALAPGSLPEKLILAAVAEADGDNERAIALYMEARELHRLNFRPSRQLALIHQRRGNTDEAVRFAAESLRLLPYQPDLEELIRKTGRSPQTPIEAPRSPSPLDDLPEHLRPQVPNPTPPPLPRPGAATPR